MKGWVLSTAIVPGTPYYDDIWPLTDPIFAAYADRWEMAYEPHLISPTEREAFLGQSPAPPGTEADYAHVPRWRQQLDEYEGVVFMDSDAVIVNHDYDICRRVNEWRPIGAVVLDNVVNFGVVAMKATPRTRMFVQEMWDMRHAFKHYQWLEQAAAMWLLGYDPQYPGDREPGRFLSVTQYTSLFTTLSGRWNSTPFHMHHTPWVLHPAGVQPYSERLRLLHEYVDRYHTSVDLSEGQLR